MERISFDNGLKTYEIEDARGNLLGEISVNLSDIGFAIRLKDFQNNILQMVDDVQKLPEDADAIETTKALDAKVKGMLNELFGDDDTASIVLGNQSAFATKNGVTLIERFLKAMLPVIERDIVEEQKRSEARISKYLGSGNE